MDSRNATLQEGDGPSALGHLRVLDLARVEGQYCGKILADLGADVIKIERLGGDPTRFMAPFAKDDPTREGSLYFANYNTNKRSVTLDLITDEGQDKLRRLAASADVLIESFTPGYLDDLRFGFRELSRVNPGLVVTSISPFGQCGPYREFLGSELIAQAMGGLMYLQGDDTKPPCAAPCDQASQLASLHAAYGTLAALQHRRETGRGQHVDISMQEVVAHLLFPIPQYAYTGEVIRRTGKVSTIAPSNYYQCKDGRVCLAIFFPHHWSELVEWMGNEALADPVWQAMEFRRSNADVIDQFVSEFVGKFTVGEFVTEGQKRHLAVSPMSTIDGLVNSPQVRERNYFINVEHPEIGNHRYPGAPYRLSETPWKVSRPAPLLGQHQNDIFQELDEVPPPELAKVGDEGNGTQTDLPLKGMRVVDFTRVWAGPYATRYLADLGAEVIKIETSRYLDNGRVNRSASPMFPEINRSKLGVTVNFQDPDGLELVKRLVGVSDVVVDNFVAGVMERRGVGYDNLKAVKPDVVMVSMPGYGTTGPYSRFAAYGQSIMSYTGLSLLWGHPDSPEDTRPKVHYSDYVSAATAATAIMVALEYRSQTGGGQYIEISQAEALVSTMGVAVLDYLVNERSWHPTGNRSLNAAPHGCYPCSGDDQWCVIACWSGEQWNTLRKAMGDPSWARASGFGSMASRIEHQDELDDRISAWTRNYTPYQVMRLLQGEGVPVGVVQSGEQLYHDHHLRARNFIVPVDHPGWATLEHTGITVNLSDSPGRIVRGLPELGQHNHYVFSDLLGTTSQEMAHLIENKVMA